MKHQMKTYMQIYRQHKRLAGILCAVLAVAVMVAAVPMFTTHAETWEVQLDENGEAHDGSVHYKLEDGVLTVSGTGKIRYEAFYGYSGITSIVIESGITEIGGGAFRNTGLTSVTIPGNVKAINSDAFFQCKNLTALTIQEGVEVLGSSAFNQCEKLTSVTLPSSVKEIYSYAFNFCPLTNLTFQSSITNDYNSAVDFNYLTKTTLVHIPNDFKINGVTITPENKSDYFGNASVVFVPVQGISLPETYTMTLYKTCFTVDFPITFTPIDASVRNVTWSSSNNNVVNTTSFSDRLIPQSPGTATLTATTQDGGYTATCTVTVIQPVTGVTLNQNTLSLPKGTTANLTATVKPNNASNTNVTWSSDDTSVATVGLNGTVTAKSKGTAKITVTTDDGNKTAHCDVTVTEPVTGVTLDKDSLTLAKGNTATLTATVAPAEADNQNVTWSSSDDTVATVENGIVTGVAKGSATITVTTADGGKTATCTVTVTQPVTGVTLNKASLNLLKGESETLMATVEPSNANNQNVTWSSSDDNVATVDQNGTVTAVEGGTAKITVTTADGSFTADCTVKVIVPVTGVTLNKTSLKLEVNQTADLTATVVPSNADNKNITWASTNETVATVDQNGTVTAKAPGQAIIAAIPEDDDHLDPDQTDVCTVTVTPPVAQVTLEPTTLTLIETQSATLTATVEPDDANNKNVTWSSSDDSVAKVDQNGEVTAVGAGTAKITVTTEDGGKTATCAVTVQPLYQLNEPKSQTKWYKGSTDGTTFTFNNQVDDTKTYTKFDSYTRDKVFVDDTPVDASKYTAAEGSLILTLSAAYLETLGVGDHTLKVMFTDGSAYIIFTVSPKPAAVISSAFGYELQSASAGPTTYDSPYTGEGDGMIAANVVLLAIVAAGAAYGLRKRHGSQSL